MNLMSLLSNKPYNPLVYNLDLNEKLRRYRANPKDPSLIVHDYPDRRDEPIHFIRDDQVTDQPNVRLEKVRALALRLPLNSYRKFSLYLLGIFGILATVTSYCYYHQPVAFSSYSHVAMLERQVNPNALPFDLNRENFQHMLLASQRLATIPVAKIKASTTATTTVATAAATVASAGSATAGTASAAPATTSVATVASKADDATNATVASATQTELAQTATDSSRTAMPTNDTAAKATKA